MLSNKIQKDFRDLKFKSDSNLISTEQCRKLQDNYIRFAKWEVMEQYPL